MMYGLTDDITEMNEELDRLRKIAACFHDGDEVRFDLMLTIPVNGLNSDEVDMLRRMWEAAKLAEEEARRG